MLVNERKWVLQFVHGYDGPFMDCARQYAVLFKDTDYKVCTVYLTGEPNDEVAQGSASDEVIFLNYTSKQVRGLKRAAIKEFKKIVNSRNFTLCIAHRFKPIYIALFGSKLPVIGVHHAFGDYKRRSRQLLANHFRNRLRLLGVSNAVRDDMRASLPKFKEEHIQTLYNRIDVEAVQAEQVSREEARQFLDLPQDAWVVGNVGRLHPDKDQTTLIKGFAKALPELPDGSLLAIMGSGRLEQQLKQLADDLGVAESVHFLSQVPNGRRYFKAFDLFALTSDHEPFGMVLLEAMAAGVPVIATDCGGAKEVVVNENMLFPLHDVDELRNLLVRQLIMRHNKSEEVVACLEKVFSDEAVKKVYRKRYSDFNLREPINVK